MDTTIFFLKQLTIILVVSVVILILMFLPNHQIVTALGAISMAIITAAAAKYLFKG